MRPHGDINRDAEPRRWIGLTVSVGNRGWGSQVDLQHDVAAVAALAVVAGREPNFVASGQAVALVAPVAVEGDGGVFVTGVAMTMELQFTQLIFGIACSTLEGPYGIAAMD